MRWPARRSGYAKWSGWRLDTPGLVATVGDLRTHPGAGNIVAGQLRASLDVRHADDAVRHRAVDTLLARADSIASRRGLTVASKMLMDQPAVAMDAGMCTMATDAIRGLGITPLSMVSGAGHDAMIMAERVPATMIFLRSPGGISHHPEEIGPSPGCGECTGRRSCAFASHLEGTEHSTCITWDIPAAIANPPICCRRRILL